MYEQDNQQNSKMIIDLGIMFKNTYQSNDEKEVKKFRTWVKPIVTSFEKWSALMIWLS